MVSFWFRYLRVKTGVVLAWILMGMVGLGIGFSYGIMAVGWAAEVQLLVISALGFYLKGKSSKEGRRTKESQKEDL